MGAYSHSKGVMLYRQMIADYINQRDQTFEDDGPAIKMDPENIFITDGASGAVKTVLELLIRDKDDAILIPIPQYPLYSSTVTRLGGTWVGYDMAEDYSKEGASLGWGLDMEEIEKKIASN